MYWNSENALSPHTDAIERYLKLLKTNLTDTEREFIKRRLAHEQQALETGTFVARANIDHFVELLNGNDLPFDRRAIIVKLLIAEEDRLSHDLEQLQFAESRAAKGRDRLNRLRQILAAAQEADRALAERVVANVEAIQGLLDAFCAHLRRKVNLRI